MARGRWRVLCSLAPLWTWIACAETESVAPLRAVQPAPQLREVRALLAADVERFRVRSEDILVVKNAEKVTIGSFAAKEWLEVQREPAGGVRLGGTLTASVVLTLRGESSAPLEVSLFQNGDWSAGAIYPGALRLRIDASGRFDLINDVEIEQYVASVVAGEVWPTFHEEAYRTQTIAVRTFVLYQMSRRQSSAWDVGATQASQVYGGVRKDETSRRAADAARFTRGVVCVWRDGDDDRLFSTYYSAACGGVSQSAAIFGEADRVPPLAGGVRCADCRIAPGETYRWGPLRLPILEVMTKLQARYPLVEALGVIANISVPERTPSGRPVRLRLVGSNGRTHDILAEHFRLALGGSVIRSTDCDIRVEGADLIVENGRGYGHGLGLCQWGMQARALAGKKAGEILRYYYPGSHLTRVY